MPGFKTSAERPLRATASSQRPQSSVPSLISRGNRITSSFVHLTTSGEERRGEAPAYVTLEGERPRTPLGAEPMVSPCGSGPVSYFGLAYPAALLNSSPTNVPLPTTQASCPGMISYASPGPMSIVVPSSETTFILPETA